MLNILALEVTVSGRLARVHYKYRNAVSIVCGRRNLGIVKVSVEKVIAENVGFRNESPRMMIPYVKF